MKINKLNKELIPISHLSPSSMMEYLVNEKSFFTKYVKGDFGEKKDPKLMVGTAFHSAMEYYYTSIIQKRDNPEMQIPTKQDLINHAISKFKKELGFAQKKGFENLFNRKCRELEIKCEFEKFYEYYNQLIGFDWSGYFNLSDKVESPEATEDEKKSFVGLTSIITMAKDYIKQIGIELDEYSGLYNEEIEEAKDRYIDWKKEGCMEDSIEEIEILINNYMDNIPNINPVFAEIGDTCEFEDFDGNEMVIPIKGKPDLIGEYKENDLDPEEVLIDFKTVSSFSKQDEISGSYELQAGSYYFIHQKITGRKPKKMLYVEVIKKELNPFKGLLKADLVNICKENGLLETGKVDELRERIMEKGLMEKPNPINIIVVDFERNPEIVQVFIEIYKEILNRTYYYFIDKTLKFLPNPRADFTGLDSWDEYKREVVCNIDPVEEFQNMLKKTESVKIEF